MTPRADTLLIPKAYKWLASSANKYVTSRADNCLTLEEADASFTPRTQKKITLYTSAVFVFSEVSMFATQFQNYKLSKRLLNSDIV